MSQEKRKILIQLDPDAHASVFDRVVAIDAGVDELFSHADFERARFVYELGCGTGRLAERILASDYCAAENLAREIILNPPDPSQVEEFFEKLAAERGERD